MIQESLRKVGELSATLFRKVEIENFISAKTHINLMPLDF
jgi:hypothetical protein